MKSNNRLEVIDFLRGLAILVMIFTHCSVYYSSAKIIHFFWNYSHFIVSILIFVSTYIFYKQRKSLNKFEYWRYLKKRFFRLLQPYYIFLIFYFLLVIFQEPKKINLLFILQSITLTGGFDFNWMILLLIYITILSPIVYFLFKQKQSLFNLLSFLSLLSTLILLIYNVKINYRLIMWLPWLLIIIFCFYFIKYENVKWMKLVFLIIALLIFILTRMTNIIFNRSLILYDNKYPPNLYYLSYGIFWINLSYLLYKKVLQYLPFSIFFNYLSKNSYSLFFIHYLIIYFIATTFQYWHWPWYQFFAIVLSISLIFQWLFNRLIRLITSDKITI